MLFQAWQYKEALTVLNTHPELKQHVPTNVYGNLITFDRDWGIYFVERSYGQNRVFFNLTELLNWVTRTYH